MVHSRNMRQKFRGKQMDEGKMKKEWKMLGFERGYKNHLLSPETFLRFLVVLLQKIR